jgi:CRISPR system Cascade subunit CasE
MEELMYLSRLLVNPRDQRAGRDLGDCQALHGRLLTAFPHIAGQHEAARASFGLLYRVDESARGHVQVLAQSSEAPEWSVLPDGYLQATGDVANPACKPVDEFYDSLAPDTRLRFRLRANPTKKIDTKTGVEGTRRNGKRVELQGEDQWLKWLERKGEQHGFTLKGDDSQINILAIDQGKMLGKHVSADAKAKITLAAVLFNGILRVTDAELFRLALKVGVGSGKAYGFGLLSVARLS